MKIHKRYWPPIVAAFLVVMVIISGCRGDENQQSQERTASAEVVMAEEGATTESGPPDSLETSENTEAAESAGINESVEDSDFPEESEGSPDMETSSEEEPKVAENLASLTVEPGAFASHILEEMVRLGIGTSVEDLLAITDQLNPEEFLLWGCISNPQERAFVMEGYIAPGTYQLPKDNPEEALKVLLHSWDDFWTEERENKAREQGYTADEVLTMASIVEYESSRDPSGEVKPQVAAVVRNRVEMPMALEMDVTVFYLQEALEPYRHPEDYEVLYDTYETAALPAGPIGSPSVESILAVLSPAESEALFFIYDDEGNYYFADDYETHLENCREYLGW